MSRIKIRPWGWEAHQALLKAEAEDPKLRTNPFWQLLKFDAYEQFEKEMRD